MVDSQPPAYEAIDADIVTELENITISPGLSDDTENSYNSDEFEENEEVLQEEKGYLAAKSAANLKGSLDAHDVSARNEVTDQFSSGL
jgi:hypothetical protein